ncbi:hypothetical protein [uncultured Rubinisphaera sp.]|uniref:hypothetical protein n=1 Tax=uncultured Rubinisphaera sp. TaxID=1678686 RepID=UPI0030DC9E4E
MEFTLASGREVFLTGFFIGATNTWVDHNQRLIAEKVLPVVRRVFPVGQFQIVGDTWLQYICIAGFNSTPLKDPDSYGSWLHLVWFVDNNDMHIRSLIEAGLRNCDWDLYAHDIYRGPNDD